MPTDENQSTLFKFSSADSTDGSTTIDCVDKELYRDESWLREQYCDKGHSQTEIAELTGVSQSTVSNWMERHGIEGQRLFERATDDELKPLRDESWLRDRYCRQERTTYEIANELGVSSGAVRNWMKWHEIERRGISEARTDGNVEPLKDESWLREQYCEQKRTLSEIGDDLGVTPCSVITWMEKHDIERRGHSEAGVDVDIELLQDESWLREQYCAREKALSKIADEVGVCIDSVVTWLDKHDIERRGYSEASTDGNVEPLKDESWLREQYCEQERTMSEIGDELHVSITAVVNWMEKHDIERQGHSRIRDPEHLSHITRSQWEIKVATILSDSVSEYEYESARISYDDGRRTYIPDFETDDYIIECKGADWGEAFGKEHTEEQKARAAMKQMDEKEYVVVGIELPCDIHIPWRNVDRLHDLF
jgi:predicted transcriptional regulator